MADTRAARAAQRQTKLVARRPAGPPPSPLGDVLTEPEGLSVSKVQLDRYMMEGDEMLSWAKRFAVKFKTLFQ